MSPGGEKISKSEVKFKVVKGSQNLMSGGMMHEVLIIYLFKSSIAASLMYFYFFQSSYQTSFS